MRSNHAPAPRSSPGRCVRTPLLAHRVAGVLVGAAAAAAHVRQHLLQVGAGAHAAAARARQLQLEVAQQPGGWGWTHGSGRAWGRSCLQEGG